MQEDTKNNDKTSTSNPTPLSVKILAFDVSETLQVASLENDGKGQFVPGSDGFPNCYHLLNGGEDTAASLKRSHELGIRIVLATNNGIEARDRTLSFLNNYGITIEPDDYLGPTENEGSGDKTIRLEFLLLKYGITKDELVFFDDSSNNIADAEAKGFKAVRVKTHQDLRDGIAAANATAEDQAQRIVQPTIQMTIDKYVEVFVHGLKLTLSEKVDEYIQKRRTQGKKVMGLFTSKEMGHQIAVYTTLKFMLDCGTEASAEEILKQWSSEKFKVDITDNFVSTSSHEVKEIIRLSSVEGTDPTFNMETEYQELRTIIDEQKQLLQTARHP